MRTKLSWTRGLEDLAGAEMHWLGFNVLIKHSSVPSAGKNQSVRVNTIFAACCTSQQSRNEAVFFIPAPPQCLPERIQSKEKICLLLFVGGTGYI